MLPEFVSRKLPYAIALVGLVHVAVYLYIGGHRVVYPFEIEWMEGGQVDVVARILEGKPVYVAPSVDYVPFIYGPGYYYAAALFAKVFGLGLLPLRLVSILSILACFVLIFDLVHRETKSKVSGASAVGLFAATYPLTGAWFELARVDSLALALLLGGVWFTRWRTSWQGFVIAGVLIACAGLTKQSMLIAFVPVGAWAIIEYRGKGVMVSLVAGVLFGLCVFLFNWASEGWFWYFTIKLPSLHPVTDEWRLLVGRLWTPLAFACLVACVGIGGAVRRAGKRGLFYTGLLFGTVATSCLSMMHSGGFLNVAMPACAGIALCFGLGMASLMAQSNAHSNSRFRRVTDLILLGGFVQLLWLHSLRSPEIPTEADVQAGRTLVAFLRETPGDVLVPDHGMYAALAGKPRHAQAMAVQDLLRSSDHVTADRLRKDIAAAVEQKRYAAIVTDEVDKALIVWGGKFDDYTYVRNLLVDQEGLDTHSGVLLRRPTFLYVPKPMNAAETARIHQHRERNLDVGTQGENPIP